VPYIIRPPRKRTLLAAVTTAIVSLGVLPALAQASACPAEGTASPLLQAFGDSHEYTVLPGSRFEGALPGWTLQRASMATEGTVSAVTRSTHSLVISAGGEVVTPAFCVSSEYPSLRFFERRVTSGQFANLSVSLRYKDAYGFTHEVTSASLAPGSSWTLSPALGLGSVLPLWQPEATLKVQLVFRSQAMGGSLAIDAVFIDPYRK
jgi:hypothetical protein